MMSEHDTERRILDAAADALARRGLTVSLDHISVEAHIRAVGKALELLTALLGYRVRPETGASFGTADWSLPGMAVGSVTTALLEPDPDIEWEAERATALLEVVGTSQGSPERVT